MSHGTRTGSIVRVTPRDDGRQWSLRDETGVDVRSTPPSAVEDELDKSRPAGVVLEVESADRTRSVLERVRDVAPSVPTVVAPPDGCESIAAAAVRGDADEYVPLDGDGEPGRRIDDAIGTGGSARDSGDRDDDDRRGDYHRLLANELPDEAFVIAADGTYLEAKVRPESAPLYTASPDELPGRQLDDVLSDDVADDIQACITRTLETDEIQSIEYTVRTTEGPRRFEARVLPIDELVDGREAVVWLARDITERARRERELRSRQRQLETLDRISAVIGDVIETLVESPSHDAIEREVCTRLVESDRFCGAWIGERTGEEALAYRTGAGDAETYLERVADTTEGVLAHRTVETGEITIGTGLPESDHVPDRLCEAAAADGVESVIAIPIAHGESIYGVLTVLADSETAVGDGQQAGFNLLGETIGFTIMAVKNRQLLFADTVVELEFRIDGGETFSFDLSEAYDCTISLEWAGTTSNGRTVQYITVDGLDGETVLEEATDHDSIENCRLIYGGGDRCTVEIRLAESGVRELANRGATIRDVTVTDGVGSCLVEISQDADVREIAEALTAIYEDTELVARREIDRSVRTAAQRRDRILDQLTDRQLTTLRLAYYSGFFDWPRESTGEDIAEAMDVSPPTMHQHLRKGLKTVLGEFFDTGEHR